MSDLQDSSKQNIVSVLTNFSDSDMNQPADNDQLKKGMKAPTFNTLLAALKETGLLTTVAQNRLTLFAPSDEAFAAAGLNRFNIGTVPGLANILLYHAVAGDVYSGDLSNGFVTTLNGAAVEIKLNGGVMVNDASVIRADLPALNGVIHIIDQILFPPTKNLVELALSFDPEFSILVQAVVKAGFADLLSTGGPFTVFAPTNAAFIDLLDELGPTVNSLDDIPVSLLQSVLLYHVVPGRVYSSDLTNGSVATAQGESFTVNLSGPSITDVNSRTAGIVGTDVQATNGVVHVINKVILPTLP
jgi:transforming growth factor-beta-induced protein